jgi:hypothetical protein
VARGDGRHHEGVLLADRLAGAGDLDERAALLVDGDVVERVQRVEEGVGGAEQAAVRAEGVVAGDGCLADLVAQRRQAAELPHDEVESAQRVRAQPVPVGTGGGVGAQPGDQLVRLPFAGQQVAAGVGATRIGQVEHRGTTFLLERLDAVLDGVAELVDGLLDAEEAPDLTPAQGRGEGPDGREGHERNEQQCHDLPPDRRTAKAHGLPNVKPGQGLSCSDCKRREPTTAT